MHSAAIKKLLLLWFLALAACTISLVPGYDQALVDGLDGANAKALTLFASLEGGSTKEEFADYKERYAEVIGTFESLRERSKSRQIPPLATRLSKIAIVRDVCDSRGDPTSCLNVTPASLDRVLEVLREVRDAHRAAGIEADTIRPLRRDYQTAMEQALTIENALKR